MSALAAQRRSSSISNENSSSSKMRSGDVVLALLPHVNSSCLNGIVRCAGHHSSIAQAEAVGTCPCSCGCISQWLQDKHHRVAWGRHHPRHDCPRWYAVLINSGHYCSTASEHAENLLKICWLRSNLMGHSHRLLILWLL